MPIYDCRLNDFDLLPGVPRQKPVPGAVPFPRFDGTAGMLLDANGVEIPWILWCNTETGAVARYDVRGGKFGTDEQTGRVVVLVETHPAPLSYVPRTTGSEKVSTNPKSAKELLDYENSCGMFSLDNGAVDEGMVKSACIPKEVVAHSETGSGTTADPRASDEPDAPVIVGD